VRRARCVTRAEKEKGGGEVALVTRFEDLRAWQEARVLTKQVYELSRLPRFSADRELVDQIRRAAVSVMSNITEGFDSGSRMEFRRFLRYAIRSSSEVQSCLYVALDQHYLSADEFRAAHNVAARVKRLSGALARRLTIDGSHRTRGVVKETSAHYTIRTRRHTAAPPHRHTATPPHRHTAAPQHKADQP
jgi:four helix bundle protein